MPVTPLLASDPDRIADHVLTGRLGSGGMGTVYLALDPDGRQVAVKVVRPDPRFLARFRSEVRRARQVPPFCTAAVLHDDLEHDPPYLVVEYVDGPSLADVVRDRGNLSPSEAYAVAVGVATALVAIHGAARSAALWRVTPFAPVRRARLDAPPDPARTVGVSPTGVLAVTAGGSTGFWDLRDPGRPVPARQAVAGASGASRVRVTGSLLLTAGTLADLSGEPRPLLANVLDIDPARDLAAVLDQGSRVLVYRIAAAPALLAEIPADYLAAVFDQVTGNLVIAADNGGADASVTVWSLADPAAPAAAAVLPARGGTRVLDARGGTVVAVDRDVLTWNGRDDPGRAVRSVERRGRTVIGPGAISLSADGSLLAVAGFSGIELWSLPGDADPLLVAMLPGRPSSVAFSPRDPLLTVADPGGTTIWDVSALQMTLRDPLADGCVRQGGLTEAEWTAYVPALPFAPACR